MIKYQRNTINVTMTHFVEIDQIMKKIKLFSSNKLERLSLESLIYL